MEQWFPYTHMVEVACTQEREICLIYADCFIWHEFIDFFSSNLIFCLFIDFHFPPLSSSPLPLWRLNAIDIAPNNIIKIIVPICAQKDKRKASLGTLHLPLCCAGRACVSISRVNHNDGVFASRETSVLGYCRFLSSEGHLRLWPLKTITLSFKVRVIIVWIFSYGW